jgi:tetratricopeptide (TPR) repeat protein
LASRLKTLLEQIHHRSLWQITLAYGAGVYAVLGVFDTLGDLVGLPEWVSKAVFVLCLAVFPLVIATAYIQKRGIGGPELVTGAQEKGLRRLLSWRNLLTASGAALALLAAGTGGYMGMRVMGIGPMGTLQAKGIVPDTARVLVADIKGSGEDSLTAAAVTEEIYGGLGQSPALRVVSREELGGVLTTMRRAPGGPLGDSLAREVAVRAGIPLLLTGDLRPVGDVYQLAVHLVDPDSNRVLLTHTETAGSEGELITADGAVNRLTGHLRERIGESLRSVRRREALPSVTTSSLEALKLFARARGLEGAERQAALEAAVELDPDFGMALRALASSYRLDSEMGIQAFDRAFEVADRLPEQERLYVIQAYYLMSNIDYERSAAAGRRLVARYPDYPNGWVNLSQALYRMGAYEEYQEVCQRAIDVNVGINSTWNLWDSSLLVRDTANAWRALALAEENGFWVNRRPEREARTAHMAGDRDRARRHLLEWRDWATQNEAPWWEAMSHFLAGFFDGMEGRRTRMGEEFARAKTNLNEARSYLEYYWDALLADWDRIVLDRREAEEEMLAAVEAWESHLPPDYSFDVQDAHNFASSGMAERAKEVLEEWVARAPDRIRRRPGNRSAELAVRGEIAQTEGRTEEALEYLRQAALASTMASWHSARLAFAYDGAGASDSALVAYRRYLDGPYHTDRVETDRIYLPLAYERLGQLYEERGELEEAARYHALFVDLWADADPELQPRVEAARGALARIAAQGVERSPLPH